MWKKHGKAIVRCSLASVLIVLLILLMVWAFEKYGIHVPGTREMWIGLIGAVIGGAFTLIGVLQTIYKQEESEEENRRLNSMPILGFNVLGTGSQANTTYTYMDGEIITSAFELYKSKEWLAIEISVVNKRGAFDFIAEEFAINGRSIPVGKAFAPCKERIVEGENTSIAFDDETILKGNFWCVIRFSYKDIWGNKYYQDLPFTYVDITEMVIAGEEKKCQKIEIRDIKPPILVVGNTKCLRDSLDEYMDYEVFGKLDFSH